MAENTSGRRGSLPALPPINVDTGHSSDGDTQRIYEEPPGQGNAGGENLEGNESDGKKERTEKGQQKISENVNTECQLKRDVYPRPTSNYEIMNKIEGFKSRTKEFIDDFANTKDETRTDEETFIIIHLLKRDDSKSPILDGNLDRLAMLACCNSPHVVKKALDALLNEIFLGISDSSRIRCRNILEAEEILRSSFLEFINVDHLKAKCHRMTTYAWLITLVLLKCSKKEFTEIQPKIEEFDKELDTLQSRRENSERNIYRYGIYLARESIKRIVQSCGKRDASESLKFNIKKCENFLNGKLEKDEVKKLGQAISDGGSWLDLHVCLVFLQDLPKFYQFQENRKPVILIQMLIADYRVRHGGSKVKFLRFSNNDWQLEVLVYRLMLRLIRTSKSKAIIEQVLTGEQGCGGVLKSWEKNKSTTAKDPFVLTYLEKLCERAVFVATPNSFMQFLTDKCKGDENQSIEDLSLLQLSSTYRDKVLGILLESRDQLVEQRVSTYDALMSGRKCLLKLHQHSKEEVLRTDCGVVLPLREEIEILKILNAVPEPCRNVVQLLGSSIEAPMHMIIERTPKGDLLAYLQYLVNPPEAEVLLQIALDICNAMIYLGEHGIIHRDLCAKNCFVFMHEGNLLTKLGDFHLAILSYQSSPRSQTGADWQPSSVKSSINEDFPNQFAVRWMAVEALRDSEFSSASDVWSFGVLLFEIFTYGRKPYVNMPNGKSLDRDEEVREYVLNGNRLELHPKIPDSIRRLIQLTMENADHRPTFSGLEADLMKITFKDTGLYKDPAHYRILHRNVSGSDGY